MYNQRIIKKVGEEIEKRQRGEPTGHDWFHTYRVFNLGKKIAKVEGADLYVVELGCLLHDIADYKFHEGNKEVGPKEAGKLLKEFNADPKTIKIVQEIIRTMGFGGARNHKPMKTLEGGCVQDADFLDALGAIGIARCFAFGGRKGNPIYDPEIPPKIDQSKEEYARADHTQLNHFYEKLLLLENHMNTKTGKTLSKERIKYMKKFLSRFKKEWEGEI